MLLTERLRSVDAEARQIRENLSFHDPRSENFSNAHEGISNRDRAIRQRDKDPRWMARVAECAGLIAAVTAGRKPMWHLKEAMTTSDFPLLFGDLLYRQMLGNYMPYPVSYPNWTRIYDVNDFRNLNLYTIEGGTAALDTIIPQRAPYPEIKFTEGRYQLAVAKYGRRYGISFEMGVNDDLNAFTQRPMMMAQGARRGEELLATKLAFDANGPHASFFTAGNKNIVTGNPALSIAGLQTAFQVLAAQVDAEGSPIVIQAATLVVPPALQITAENILNTIQIRLAESGGTSNQLMYVNNWMKSKLKLAIDPYIPIVTTTGTKGNTSWMLVADPNDLNTRPAFAFGFLRGYRQPQLFVKDPDARMLGGGPADAMLGDFENDSIDYKIRHIFGAVQADPKMAVASPGQ